MALWVFQLQNCTLSEADLEGKDWLIFQIWDQWFSTHMFSLNLCVCLKKNQPPSPQFRVS